MILGQKGECYFSQGNFLHTLSTFASESTLCEFANKISFLKLVEKSIFVSEGTKLHIFDASTQSPIKETDVGDRLLDVIFYDNDLTVVALTCHGQIIVIRGAEKSVVLESPVSGLFLAGKIVKIAANEMVIVLGTLFAGLCIFSLSASTLKLTSLLFVEQAHKGTIFGIDVKYDENAFLLDIVSASDDRFIAFTRIHLAIDSSMNDCRVVWCKRMLCHDARAWKVKFLTPKTAVSAGEDGKAVFWDLIAERPTGTIQVLEGAKAGLLSLCISENDENDEMVLVGAQDGTIHCLHEPKTSIGIYKTKENFVKNGSGSYVITEDGQIYRVTNGKISLKDILPFSTDLSHFSLMCTTEKGGMCVADRHGVITLISEESVETFVHQFDLKERPLGLLADGNRILTITPTKWLLFDSDLSLLSEDKAKDDVQVTCIKTTHGTCFLGTRNGLLYKFDELQTNGQWKLFFGTGHGDAITAIQTDDSNNNNHLWFCDRAGRVYKDLKLYYHYKEVGCLERFELNVRNNDEKSNDFARGVGYLFGFYGKHFCQYRVNAGGCNVQLMHRVECGGAHRRWSFNAVDKRFRWIQDKSYRSTCMPYASFDKITRAKGYGHVREIRSLSLIENGGSVLWSAGDDGRICRDGQCVYACDAAIKSVAVVDSCYLLFAGGATEGLYAFSTSCIAGEPLSLLAKADKASPIHDVRIMSIAVSKNVLDKEEGDGFLIAAGYSDSYIRLWQYRNSTFTLMDAWEGHPNACPLQVAWWRSSSFVSGATDGHLVLYDAVSRECKKIIASLHQSGINALLIQDDCAYTGGDDGAIAKVSLIDRSIVTKSLNAHRSTVTGLAILNNSLISAASNGKMAKHDCGSLKVVGEGIHRQFLTLVPWLAIETEWLWEEQA